MTVVTKLCGSILLYLLINSQADAIVDTWLDCVWSLTKTGSCAGQSWEARRVGGEARHPLLLDCPRSWWGWKVAKSWRCRSCPAAGPGPRLAAWTSADDSRRRWRSHTGLLVGSAAPSVPCRTVLALTSKSYAPITHCKETKLRGIET